MTKISVVNAKKLITLLTKIGFVEIRQNGSHKFFKHADGRITSVPYHQGVYLGKGLLRKILNQIKLSPENFQKLLKK